MVNMEHAGRSFEDEAPSPETMVVVRGFTYCIIWVGDRTRGAFIVAGNYFHQCFWEKQLKLCGFNPATYFSSTGFKHFHFLVCKHISTNQYLILLSVVAHRNHKSKTKAQSFQAWGKSTAIWGNISKTTTTLFLLMVHLVNQNPWVRWSAMLRNNHNTAKTDVTLSSYQAYPPGQGYQGRPKLRTCKGDPCLLACPAILAMA